MSEITDEEILIFLDNIREHIIDDRHIGIAKYSNALTWVTVLRDNLEKLKKEK